jgi:hypothetical protein
MSHDGPHPHQRGGDSQRVVYDWRQSDGPAAAIIEATAEATNSQSMELPPLQEYADVDSLNALLANSGTVEIAFEYDQVTVTIAADGKLVVALDSHT